MKKHLFFLSSLVCASTLFAAAPKTKYVCIQDAKLKEKPAAFAGVSRILKYGEPVSVLNELRPLFLCLFRQSTTFDYNSYVGELCVMNEPISEETEK